MDKQIINTEHAPAARGHYSQGIAWSNLLFISGQLPMDPERGLLIEGDLAAQVQRTLQNLKAVLEAANSSPAEVLKTTVYITDIEHWPEVNRIYAEFFGNNRPARSVVPVKELHYGALIEIEAIAVRG